MSRPQLVTRPSSVLAAKKTVVLVTGGNTGIGYEIVKAIALSEPNHHVLLGCRDTAKGEAAVASMGAPTNVNPIQLDISNDQSIDHCYKAIEQLFGRLDILINNAGTAGRDIHDGVSARGGRREWAHVMNINVVSTGVFTQTMVPLLQKSTFPKIIFISSRLGSTGELLSGKGYLNLPWYNCSKAALNNLAVWYSQSYPKFKVNVVCPGLRATGLNDVEKNENTDPALGATRALQLVAEGPDGVNATYSNVEGPVPW